jgi:hypothetical protein
MKPQGLTGGLDGATIKAIGHRALLKADFTNLLSMLRARYGHGS